MDNVIEFTPKQSVEKIEPGIYLDMPFDKYNDLDAVRSHDLTAFIKDPYTWKYEEKPDSEASFFVEGRLQHCLFLEPDVFHDEFVVSPKLDRRTKAGKEAYEDFMASVNGRSVVTQDLYKTCRDASPSGFKKAIRNFSYHQQAAFYLDAAASAGLTEVDRFQFLAIQKSHPYPYAVYELSDEAIEYGRSLNEKALEQMLACAKTGVYTPYNLHNKIVEVHITDL